MADKVRTIAEDLPTRSKEPWIAWALEQGAFRVEQHGALIKQIPLTREELEGIWEREVSAHFQAVGE